MQQTVHDKLVAPSQPSQPPGLDRRSPPLADWSETSAKPQQVLSGSPASWKRAGPSGWKWIQMDCRHRLIYKLDGLWCEKLPILCKNHKMDIKWYEWLLTGSMFLGTTMSEHDIDQPITVVLLRCKYLLFNNWDGCLGSTGTNVRHGVKRFWDTSDKTRLLHSIPFRTVTFSLTSVAAAGSAEGSSATVATLVSPGESFGSVKGHPELVIQKPWAL